MGFGELDMHKVVLGFLLTIIIAAPSQAGILFVRGKSNIPDPPVLGPEVDALHWDDNYASNWTALTEFEVYDSEGTDQFGTLTNVDGAPGNDFTNIDADEYTTISNYNSSSVLIDDSVTPGVHWSVDGTSEHGVYAEWSTSFNIDEVKFWIRSTGTYGAPADAPRFYDETASEIPLVYYPMSVADVSDTSGDAVEYTYGFVDDINTTALEATYVVNNSDADFLGQNNPYEMRNNEWNSVFTASATAGDGEIIMDFGSSQTVNTVHLGPTTADSFSAAFTNNREIDYSTTSTCSSNSSGASWSTLVATTSGHADGETKGYSTGGITARCVRLNREVELSSGYFVAAGEFWAE